MSDADGASALHLADDVISGVGRVLAQLIELRELMLDFDHMARQGRAHPVHLAVAEKIHDGLAKILDDVDAIESSELRG